MTSPSEATGGDDPRETGGVSSRVALEAAREELRGATRRGAGGRAALERYAARGDGSVRQLDGGGGGASGPAPAVMALGGYGRRQLCLYSDIDVLVLFPETIGSAEEGVLRALLPPLWDLGVVVGHQVRELREFATLETDNPEFLLALLDARPVAGPRELFEAFSTAFHTAPTHAFIRQALLTLLETRHAEFNGTLYQLEPDVKDAPGALRDLAGARTLAAVTDPRRPRRGWRPPTPSCCACGRRCTWKGSGTRTC